MKIIESLTFKSLLLKFRISIVYMDFFTYLCSIKVAKQPSTRNSNS